MLERLHCCFGRSLSKQRVDLTLRQLYFAVALLAVNEKAVNEREHKDDSNRQQEHKRSVVHIKHLTLQNQKLVTDFPYPRYRAACSSVLPGVLRGCQVTGGNRLIMMNTESTK